MMRFPFLLCLLFLAAASLHAQEATPSDHYQIYGGYSLLSNSIDGVPGARRPLNGWELSLSALNWHGLAFKADLNTYRGTNQGAPQRPSFILAGGQYDIHLRRETVFAEGLLGNVAMNRYWLPNHVAGQTASFAAQLGGGLDTPLSRRLAFRLQGDLDYANFNPALAPIPSPVVAYVEVVHGLPNFFGHFSTGLVWKF